MEMKSLCFFISFSGMLALSTCSGAYADFACGAEVSYSWIRAGVPTPAPAPNGTTPPGTGDQKNSGEISAKDTPPPGSTIVRLGGIEREGLDEAAAKDKLQVEITRLKVRASEACRRDHESFGTCVTTKFSSNGAFLNSLGFSARKEVETALTDECKSQQGTCLGVVVTESPCKERIKAVPTPTPGAEKKGDGKKK